MTDWAEELVRFIEVNAESQRFLRKQIGRLKAIRSEDRQEYDRDRGHLLDLYLVDVLNRAVRSYVQLHGAAFHNYLPVDDFGEIDQTAHAIADQEVLNWLMERAIKEVEVDE